MKGSVLVVHDDLGVRRCLGEFLEAKGYKVLSASTGQEALGVLEEDVPRLLVIGVGLPLLSGWKLVEALAHYPDLSRIPRLLAHPEDAPASLCGRALALLELGGPTSQSQSQPQPDETTPASADVRRTLANA